MVHVRVQCVHATRILQVDVDHAQKLQEGLIREPALGLALAERFGFGSFRVDRCENLLELLGRDGIGGVERVNNDLVG